MKSYPYIGEGKSSGSIALIYDEGKCITLKSKTWASGDLELCEGIKEECFKNITSKHLERKCVEIKSKEHGHFIQQLAFNANYLWSGLSSEKRDISSGYLVFGRQSTIISLKTTKPSTTHESVTIPLPPESNTNTPEEDFEMKQIHLDACASEILDVLYSDLSSEEKHNKQLEILAKYIVKECESRIVDQPEENAGMNLIFGDADKCKEWPCVNDEVLTSDGKGVVRLLSDSKGYYVVSVDGEYYQYQIDELSKPKTPEQELRDELKEIIHTAMTNNFGFLNGTDSKLVDYMIDSYNITKKPQ